MDENNKATKNPSATGMFRDTDRFTIMSVTTKDKKFTPKVSETAQSLEGSKLNWEKESWKYVSPS